ncbi:type II CRISPR RNA-guided endonuclease Cas9 [Lactobacillus corticis]|uniref:Type II CRISPR RNA-guided endonuclease Cas9 n=1 Tax=Lactobacillus corticis TaxID=2201249 RepID=A0A916QJB6_9LACO|nr:type II CRISPR RNA-guided endonuclease Cas9 [Lactobacillus corticis]GFZ26121.1 hypothetical protein LCB40_00010 [Lactobacillus corticis]
MVEYIVGLDIGTNSCGWVVTDKDNSILRIKGKTAIGAYLFDEGKTAAERRNLRTKRRRLKRRKWRLGLLEEIFDPEISKIDPTFFACLKESDLSPKDSRKKYSHIIFPTKEEENAFYTNYPTIYHLRKALMTDNQKHDLREIYLAVHHMVKYRGNFLHEGAAKNFSSGKIEVEKTLREISSQLEFIFDNGVQINLNHSKEIEDVIKDKATLKADKIKEIIKLLSVDGDKELKKTNKDLSTQIVNAIMGRMTNLSKLLNLSDKDQKIRFSDPDFDKKIDNLNLSVRQGRVVEEIMRLYSAIVLDEIVPGGKSISEYMVEKYNDHGDDLKLLKKVIRNHKNREKAKALQALYDLYVRNRYRNPAKLKSNAKPKPKPKPKSKDGLEKRIYNQEDLFIEIKKNLRRL